MQGNLGSFAKRPEVVLGDLSSRAKRYGES